MSDDAVSPELARAIEDLQQSQREALAALMNCARKRPKAAHLMAEQIVQNWSASVLDMLSLVALDRAPAQGAVQ